MLQVVAFVGFCVKISRKSIPLPQAYISYTVSHGTRLTYAIIRWLLGQFRPIIFSEIICFLEKNVTTNC